MTDAAPSPARRSVTVAGSPVQVWLRAHRRELVDRVLTDVDRPGTAREVADLRWIVDHNIELFARRLDHPDLAPDEVSAAELVASASGRAREGRRIDDLLRDYVGGATAIWRALAEHAGPDEQRALVDLVDLVFDHLRAVVGLVARGFQHEAARVSIHDGDARFTLYAALLAGHDPGPAAAQAGLTVADRYAVVSLRLGTGGSSGTGRAGDVARLRREMVVRDRLDELAGAGALALLRDPAGTALIPLPADPSPDERAAIRRTIGSLAAELGTAVHAGVTLVEPHEVAEAVPRTEEILELVAATDRESGAYFLDDVLLPYQLTRPGPGRDLLAARMRALDTHPDWETTLRAYVGAGHDRRRAAAALHVHPNTVDYRLRRIAETCGLDATDAAERAAAVGALAVRDLERFRARESGASARRR